MIQTINDWKPEVRSLLKSLEAAGCKLIHSNNGEDTLVYNGNRAAFIDHLIACDEAYLRVEMPDGQKRTLYLVFGNSPGELVADYGLHEVLDKITDDHYSAWENRKQPKITGAYLNGKFVKAETYRRAQLAFVAKVNAIIHADNLYAHVGFNGQDRRVIDCYVDAKGDVVVRDLYDNTKTYIVNYTNFRNGRGEELNLKGPR